MSLFEDMIDKGLSYDTIQNKKKRKKEDSLFTAMIDEGKSYEEITNNHKEINQENNKIGNNIEEKSFLPKIGEKLLFPLKTAGSGVVSGITGIAQAGLTDSANEMNKGKENKKLGFNLIDSLLGLVNPTYGTTKSIRNASDKIKDIVNTLSNKDKNAVEKITDIGLNATDSAINDTPVKSLLNSTNQIIGKVNPNSSENILNINEKISQPSKKIQEYINKEAEKQDGFTRLLGNATQSVGNMLPSITASIISGSPSVGLAVMGTSVKGQSTQEALDRGTDLEKAVKIGNTKAMIEIGTEMMSGGLNIFGKGALDDIVTKGIDKKVKNEVANFLLKKGIDIPGEILEETISDVLGTVIDKGTVDPNATYSIKDWSDTALTTTLSTVILNALTGGYGKNAYRTNQINMKDANSQIYTDYDTGNVLDKKTQGVLNQAENIIKENKTNQNQTSEQINNIPIDKYNISAKKYNIDTKNETVQSIKKVTEQRGINTTYNAEMFKDSTTNAIWRTTTDTNGNTIREVILNPKADTNKTLQNVIVHELTHDFEGTKEYTQLADTIMKNVTTKTDYETARKALEETYSKVYDKNSVEFKNLIDQEAVADVLGNKLGNQEFVSNLTMEQPSVAKRIYNWVIDKLNKITGYSNERIFWTDVKNKFENAYRQDYKENKNNSKYSIQTDNNGNKYVKVDTDQDIFNGIAEKDYNKIAKMYMQDYLKGKTNLSENDSVSVGNKGISKYTNPKQTTRYMTEKMKLSTELKNALEIAQKDSISVPTKDTSKYPKWEYYKFNFELGGKNFEGTINIGIDKDGNKHFYEINKIHFTGISSVSTNSQNKVNLINENHTTSNSHISASKSSSMDSIKNSIAPTKNDVNTNTKYSMQESGNNTQLSKRAEKELHRYVHMDKEQLNKAFSDAVENKENMLEEYNTLSKEYKEFQKTEEFMNVLKNEDYDSEVWNKAGKYADKLRYYNENYEKYKAQQEAINSLLMDNNTETRSSNQIVEEAEKHFGTTRNFKETAYIDINGKQIDFSGKHEGGMSGRRSLDHRQINEIDTDMQSFIDMGNIRVMPEGNGINLSVEPNEKQYNTLSKYIDSVNGELYIDINKTNTRYDSATYKAGTSTGKILNDIRYYFKNGEFPKQSEFAQFRYSIIKDNAWQKFLNKNYKNEGTGETIKDVKLPPVEKKKIGEKIPNNKETNLEKYNKNKAIIIKENERTINDLILFKNYATNNIETQIKQKQESLKTIAEPERADIIKKQIENLKDKKTKMEEKYNADIDKFNSKNTLEKVEMKARTIMKEEARNIMSAEIEPLVEDLTKYKDKKAGILYNRETAQRNIEDIVKDKELAKTINETIFDPVQVHQAEKTRVINDLFEKINDLEIDKTKKYEYKSEEGPIYKVDEATLAQLLIEKKISDTNLRSYYNLSEENISKIHKIANTFTEILDNLYDQMNEVQIQYGYTPIGKIKNYFPHFFENKTDTTLGKIASYFGIDLTNQDLPTEIAGKTDTFKPGRTWDANIQKRRTNKTDYNALAAMEKYISGAADLIYTTQDIQKVREYSRQIRYKFSDKGMQEAIDNIYQNENLSQEAKDAQLEGIFENTQNELSKFVTWLDDYANGLANKKSFSDRNIEREAGRQIYSTMSSIESRIAANTIGGNLSVSLTNFAPLFQSMGTTRPNYIISGMLQTTKNNIKRLIKGEKDTSFVNNSNFLTNRFGVDSISEKKMTQKISDITSIPMNAIDEFTAESIVRAKYLENLDKGMSEEVALDNADKYSAKIMADRSKGAIPLVFNKKNPIAKLMTMFQVEPNNIVSNYLKDMPRDAKSKTQLAYQYSKLMIASYAFNTMAMAIRGGSEVLPDPIRIVSNLIKMLVEDDDDEKEKAQSDLIDSIVGSTPFLSNVAGLVGMEDIGRIPISNAMPNITNIGKLFDKDADSKYKKEIIEKELSKPLLYLGLPVGGAQLKKTIEGIAAVNKGGSYKTSKEGEKQLQFPVENKNIKNYLKAGIFGKWSLDEAQMYTKTLTPKQTKSYEESKIPYKEYLEYLSKNLKKNEDKINYLSKQNWSENQKWGIYKNEILSNTKRKEDGGSQLKDAEYIISKGMSKTDFINLYNKAQLNNIDIPTQKDYKKMERTGISLEKYIDYKVKEKTEEKRRSKELTDNQDLKDTDKIQILLNSNYSNKEISAIYENYIKNTKDTQYYIVEESGMDIKEYLKYKQQNFESDRKDDGTINGKAISKSKQKKEYEYVNNMKITYNQKLILLGMQYSLTSGEKTKLANYVNEMNLNKKEKLEVYEKLKGFKVYKDGRVTW